MSDAKDMLTNFEFQVQLGLLLTVNFSRISDISSQGEFDVRADGGNNDRMFFAAKPHRTPDVMVFHKGWSTGLDSAVMSWLTQGLIIDGIMIIVKQNGSMKKILYIEQGILSRISYSDLDAIHGDVMIKSMELRHTGIKEYPLSI